MLPIMKNIKLLKFYSMALKFL